MLMLMLKCWNVWISEEEIWRRLFGWLSSKRWPYYMLHLLYFISISFYLVFTYSLTPHSLIHLILISISYVCMFACLFCVQDSSGTDHITLILLTNKLISLLSWKNCEKSGWVDRTLRLNPRDPGSIPKFSLTYQ